MSHFVRERGDQDWYRELKVPHTVIRNIDEKTASAISGTGGSYTPSSAIVIGGAGMEFQCAVQLTNATAHPGEGNVFRFGAGDYFKHASLVSRSIVDSPLLLLLGSQRLQREARIWTESTGTNAPSLRTRRAGAFVRMPLRIPDGALLSSVEIGFKVGQAHANVPAILPSARVVRILPTGVVEQHPKPSSTSFDENGWVNVATPVSGVAWYAAGALQTHTLSYDYANLEPADTSLYAYAVEWREERGGNAFTDSYGNHLVYLKMTIYQADLRPY